RRRFDVERRRVGHQRGIDAFEGAARDHDGLAADVFLRRRPEHDERDRVRRNGALEAERTAEASRRDEVVPAGVDNLRQSTVLAQVGERDRPLAPALAESRLQAERAPLDGEPTLLQPPREEAARALLLHRELRIRVNLARDLDQLVTRIAHRCLRRSLSSAHQRAFRCGRGHGALYSTRAGAIIRHALWNRGSLASMVTPMSSAILARSKRRRKRPSRRGRGRHRLYAFASSPTTSARGATSAPRASSSLWTCLPSS